MYHVLQNHCKWRLDIQPYNTWLTDNYRNDTSINSHECRMEQSVM
jgi:hypothetical protein